MILVPVSDDLYLLMPEFIHKFGDPEPHNFRGSLRLHQTIERVLYRIREWLCVNDAMPGSRCLEALLTIVFGLNCGFPLKDIASYVAWYLKGCPATDAYSRI